jgi:signal transduction histidine kinase
MRINYDTLISRIILILILGIAIVSVDIMLVTALFDQEEQSLLNLLTVVIVELAGLVLIAYVISRQLVKPLKQLSEMAQRFSIDMHTEPLLIKGPKEVRDTAQSFNLMQQRIQRFVEERMLLIAAISHDLRTPLTRLRLRVDNLPDQEQRQKALVDLDEMSSMIQSTLAFVRDDSSKEASSKTDIASLVRTVCDDTSDILGPAEYSGPHKHIIMCRPKALKRALCNLIENAVKYGVRASVTLSCTEGITEIVIEDQGEGILEEEFENVFLPFYRIENSRNRKTGGVGLGLSVSRTIIQGSGGDISLENQQNGGLRVKVKLPDAELSSQPPYDIIING